MERAEPEGGGKMNKLVFIAEWHGERAAGINPGHEEITIQFKYGQPVDDQDTIDYWREAIQDFYDGAKVVLKPNKTKESQNKS
jgi:hypothetical protein